MDFVFDPSLVLYLPLWKLDGASIMSQDAYGHTCTVTGALWRPNGYYFDGADDLITVPDHAQLRLTADATIIAWINLATATWLIDKEQIGAPWPGWKIFFSSEKLVFNCDGNNQLTATTAITLNEWQQVAVTIIGTTVAIFLNGNLDKSGTGAHLPPASWTGDAKIGVNQAESSWSKGTIGEFTIYSRGFAPLEIQHNYLATKWRYR